jgi:hypothetical protein
VKRIVVIFCLLCYVTSSVSLSIYFNYCNDKLSQVALYSKGETDECCSEDINDDCCNSDIISINKTDDHRVSAPYSLVLKPATAFTPFPCFFTISEYLPPLGNAITGRTLKPPLLITKYLNLNILHSVFLI